MALSVNNSDVLRGNSVPISGYPFSLAGWFRVPDVNHYVPLVGFTDSATSSAYEIFFAGYSSNKSAGVLVSVSGGVSAQSTSPMIPGQWHHIVAVFSSNTSRKIFLDGGNSAVNTSNRAFVGADSFYIGNKNTAAPADVAEVAVIQASVSDSQAVTLAKGCPILASSLAKDVVAFYDFVRQPNRPGLGPIVSSAGTPGVVAHPRMLLPKAGLSVAIPDRVRGPFRIEEAHGHSLSDRQGLLANVGIVSTNSVFSGEVVS